MDAGLLDKPVYAGRATGPADGGRAADQAPWKHGATWALLAHQLAAFLD